MWVRFLIGIGLIALGAFMLIKSDLLMSWFGRITWAEEKLGAEGGTRIFYKIAGMGLIVLAFLIMSGKIIGILDFIFKRGV
ncbi:MAG TPA: hypothetical protein DEG44_00200 [Candidatus Kerfeldbacteria bacterium]|nr:hypothetical protein [Candidatus Kerfeldbacteria bacterium]